MVRSLETGRGVDWLGVGMGMIHHLTRPLQARTGGAAKGQPIVDKGSLGSPQQNSFAF